MSERFPSMQSKTGEPKRRPRVAIVYPFFAHYRAPVISELLEHGAHDYYFVGDLTASEGGIPLASPLDESRFIHAGCIPLRAGVMWQRRLLGLVLSGNFDCFIFLGNAAWPATWLAAVLCRIRRLRTLFWTHGWLRRDRGLRGWIRALFYRLANGLLLYGHRAKAIGIQAGFAPATLHIVFNSLDFEAQQALRAAISTEHIRKTRIDLFGRADIPVVIASARLTMAKRFDLLIRALGLLERKGTHIHLVVVGDGPQRTELETLSIAEGIRVAFVGACYDETKLASLFSIANVMVSPGNIGLSCMHSLGYGVPAITHDDADDQMPEWEAISPGLTGDLFKRDSVESLAEAIERWTRSALPDEVTRTRCIESIAQRYHPAAQRRLIDNAVSGALPIDC